jgi:signal transduction histidine kinase
MGCPRLINPQRDNPMNFRTLSRWIAGAAFVIGFHAPALAQEHGTRDEAKSMVEAAVAHVKKVGPEQAFKDFTDKSNKAWQKKDLYVMAYRNDGTCVGHGANDKLIGKNLMELKDPNGKPLIKELIAAAAKGGDWVEYDWAHPQTKKIEGKVTYARKLENFDGWVGVGVYR